MTKIIGFIFITPLLWVLLSIVLLDISWFINKRTSKWETKNKSDYTDEYLGTLMFASSLIILFGYGMYLLKS